MRTTLMVWLLIPLALLVTLSTLAANHFAEDFANKSFDSFLLNSCDSIAARVHIGVDGLVFFNLPTASQNLFRHGGKDKFFYQVVGNDGRLLAGNLFLPQAKSINNARFGYAKIGGQRIRFCSLSVESGGKTALVQVGETLNSRNCLLDEIFLSILVPQVVLVALTCLVVWIGVGYGLKPLHKLGAILRERSNPDLSPVRIENTPAELEPVTDALNRLFQIIEGYCRLQREFVANAAHQLRTPTAALKTYIDHFSLTHNDSSLEAFIGQLKSASDRLAELVNRLLILARAEASPSAKASSCDIAQAVAEAAAVVIQQALKKKIEFSFTLPENPVLVPMDAGDLIEVVLSLLDNAIKYVAEAGSIWVRVRESDTQVRLLIEDNGPGIEDAEKERVFQRFYRAPANSSVPGCGLGLAIVKEFCAAAGASVILSDRAGGGASFEIVFDKRAIMRGVLEQAAGPGTASIPAGADNKLFEQLNARECTLTIGS